MSQNTQQQQKEEFFETVGKHAQAVDEQEDQAPTNGELEAQMNPVQEIESLCMECQETVSIVLELLVDVQMLKHIPPGLNATFAD